MAEPRTIRTILLNCPYCRARVAAEVKSDLGFSDDDHPEICISLARCPTCRYPLVAYEMECGMGGDFDHPQQVWSVPSRLWPEPEVDLSAAIPETVADSLKEARICLSTGAYTACVAMTGRALEAIGRHFHAKSDTDRLMLGRGIEELHKSGVIDHRLYEWGKELHQNRNLAAHATNTRFEREDAEDLFNFASSICDYIFVLTAKFEEFKRRQSEKVPTQKVSDP